MFTLLSLPVGETAEVISVAGGWGMQRNLASLGFMPGKKVRKIAVQPIGGPVMVEVERYGRSAIGRGMAAKILVKRKDYACTVNGQS